MLCAGADGAKVKPAPSPPPAAAVAAACPAVSAVFLSLACFGPWEEPAGGGRKARGRWQQLWATPLALLWPWCVGVGGGVSVWAQTWRQKHICQAVNGSRGQQCWSVLLISVLMSCGGGGTGGRRALGGGLVSPHCSPLGPCCCCRSTFLRLEAGWSLGIRQQTTTRRQQLEVRAGRKLLQLR